MWAKHLRIFQFARPKPYTVCGRAFTTVWQPALSGSKVLNQVLHDRPVSTEELEATAPPAHYLHSLAELVAEARQKPARLYQRSIRRPNQLGQVPCQGCGRYLEPAAFRKARLRCKSCERSDHLNYNATLRGTLMRLAFSSKARSVIKNISHCLDLDDLLDMLLEQEGRCAYSGVALELMRPCTHWRMSLERRDNSEGYVRDNCVFVAGEFNSSDFSRCRGVREQDVSGTAQWSAHKVASVSNLGGFRVDAQRLHADVSLALECPRLSCAQGRQEYTRAYNRTLRGRAKILVSSASKRCAQVGHVCEMGYGDILQMLLAQGGRCFYSGVPLRYDQPHVDWQMSLERLDNSLEYTKENCVLIAAEFNTPDQSKHAVREVRGSSQWSRAKVMHVWGHARCL
ncbi:unnamed protein product [Symbiodinium sp. CCMP2456]|nr:unnamed protein product [Symbiodinium sp. CCMP2456]